MCGIALIRLRKPLEHYVERYGSYKYGLKKLYLLMQKQNNRGQDGAGVVNVKLDVPPGKRYISRYRSVSKHPIEDIFGRIDGKIKSGEEELGDVPFALEDLKSEVAFTGEVMLGHLRYGTHGGFGLENVHPFLRQSNWKSRTLTLAGNFNLTNVDELFDKLVDLGQHPKDKVDTVLVLEKIGHFLDEENRRFYAEWDGKISNWEIHEKIENELDLQRTLQRASKYFDGGYAIAGITGYGASFVMRDPNGIRPAYYYANEEIVVAASEKSAIKTAFGIEYKEIQEVPPGYSLIIEKDGSYKLGQIVEPRPKLSCSFERIYFSRASDPLIYEERKQLGNLLSPKILEAIDYDLDNTVFSYIPNTSETAFLGMIKGIEDYLVENRRQQILENPSAEQLQRIYATRPRVEKLVIKDVKLRTFITDDDHRDELVSHVYDTTYEVIKKGLDTLVVIDDSIVRGTTLEKSILRMLDRLEPKKIIIVSSAPQIRFPDCYGIDMSKMKDFIAFRAVKSLLDKTGRENLLDEVFEKCRIALDEGRAGEHNYVKELYEPYEYTAISNEIARIITSDYVRADVEVIYQTVDNLHKACPNHHGDWYFTGDYPTPGGNIVVNQAFVNFCQGIAQRAY